MDFLNMFNIAIGLYVAYLTTRLWFLSSKQDKEKKTVSFKINGDFKIDFDFGEKYTLIRTPKIIFSIVNTSEKTVFIERPFFDAIITKNKIQLFPYIDKSIDFPCSIIPEERIIIEFVLHDYYLISKELEKFDVRLNILDLRGNYFQSEWVTFFSEKKPEQNQEDSNNS